MTLLIRNEGQLLEFRSSSMSNALECLSSVFAPHECAAEELVRHAIKVVRVRTHQPLK